MPRSRVNHTPGVNQNMQDMFGNNQNHMTPSHGGSQPGMTTFSGGFNRNPLSRRTADKGGFLN